MDRLPSGRHGLPRDYIDRNQRRRLLAATTGLLSEHGCERTTVTLIGARSGVSKSDFYRHFESKDAAFAAAYEAAANGARRSLLAGCGRGETWAEGVREGLAALLAHLVEEPAGARLALVEGQRAGREIALRHRQALRGFAALLREGAPSPIGSSLPDATHEAVVGAVATLLGSRILAGEGGRLAQFLPGIAEFALTPYLGVAGARLLSA